MQGSRAFSIKILKSFFIQLQNSLQLEKCLSARKPEFFFSFIFLINAVIRDTVNEGESSENAYSKIDQLFIFNSYDLLLEGVEIFVAHGGATRAFKIERFFGRNIETLG